MLNKGTPNTYTFNASYSYAIVMSLDTVINRICVYTGTGTCIAHWADDDTGTPMEYMIIKDVKSGDKFKYNYWGFIWGIR